MTEDAIVYEAETPGWLVAVWAAATVDSLEESAGDGPWGAEAATFAYSREGATDA